MPAPPNPTPGIANDTASWTELRARAHAHALAAATSALAASVAARNNSQHQLKQHSPPVETTSVSSRQEQLWVPYDEQQHLACTVPARALNASTTQLSDTEASQPTSRSSDSPVPCRAKKKAILGPATTTKTKRCRQRSRPAQDAGLTVWKLTDLCASPTMYVSDSFLDPIVKDDDDDMNGGKKEDGFGRYISGKDRSGNAVAPDGKMVAKKSKFLWMKRPNPRKK
ncbi:hypothetical protein HK101_006047 [Irineochytrium annulatum]|nr:hypothetical protein HK101_006047 [Irineochytrium annulatum]